MTEHRCNLAVEHCAECTAAQRDSGERPRPLRAGQDGHEASETTTEPAARPARQGFTATPAGHALSDAPQENKHAPGREKQ